MQEDKKVQAPEVSLKYIAWDIKSLVKEIQKLNENLECLIKKPKKDDLF